MLLSLTFENTVGKQAREKLKTVTRKRRPSKCRLYHMSIFTSQSNGDGQKIDTLKLFQLMEIGSSRVNL